MLSHKSLSNLLGTSPFTRYEVPQKPSPSVTLLTLLPLDSLPLVQEGTVGRPGPSLPTARVSDADECF